MKTFRKYLARGTWAMFTLALVLQPISVSFAGVVLLFGVAGSCTIFVTRD